MNWLKYDLFHSKHPNWTKCALPQPKTLDPVKIKSVSAEKYQNQPKCNQHQNSLRGIYRIGSKSGQIRINQVKLELSQNNLCQTGQAWAKLLPRYAKELWKTLEVPLFHQESTNRAATILVLLFHEQPINQQWSQQCWWRRESLPLLHTTPNDIKMSRNQVLSPVVFNSS